MTDPLISIQLTTYNRSGLVQRAINSLLTQTYPHIRILVCDNGSSDATGPVIRRITEKDRRVIYTYYPENKEGLKNVTAEINKIDTPYFSFLSDDDWLLPNFFEDALKEFKRHPECGFVALNTRMVDTTGRTIRKSAQYQRWEGYYKPPHGAVMILEGGFLTWTGILFRKELIKNIRLWDKICIINDLSYELAGALEFPISVSAKEGAVFTHHHESFSTTTPLHYVWPCYLESIAAVNKYCVRYPAIKEYVNAKLMQRLRRRLLWTGMAGLYRRDAKTAHHVIQILREQFGYKRTECWILACFCLLYDVRPEIAVSVLRGIIRNKPRLVSIMDYIGYLRR